jgi:hypothetical protein
MRIFSANKNIVSGTILQRKSDSLFSEIDGEVVMLSIENGEYYGMDEIGSRIWHLLENPLTFKELIAKLTVEFTVSDDQCKSDVIGFLDKLIEKKLILLDLKADS